MRLRNILITIFIFLAAVLFFDGIYHLAQQNSQPGREFINYEPLRSQKESSILADEPVNLLILGMDGEEIRSDVIVLVNYSPSVNALNILSIARDTKVYVKGRSVKFNALAAIGGEGLVADEVEKLTGLPVHYYLTLNFEGFRRVIDVLGGVEIDVPFNMVYDDPDQNLHIRLKKGRQVLNGNKAEQFVRYRKGNRPGQGYTDGDIGRIGAQQTLMRALIDQKLKLKFLTKADDIYFILKEHMKTNIEIGDLRRYIKGLSTIRQEDIRTFTLPGDSRLIDRAWYFIHDSSKLEKMITDNFYR